MTDDPDSQAAQQIRQTRDRLPRLHRLADSDDVYDGVELFGALCDYLDQLYGPPGFDRLLPPADRTRVISVINRIRADRRAEDPEVPRRLTQPVSAAITLDQGRQLADRLAGADDWRSGLGDALIDLYDYLDQLHGGAFTELLNSAERRRVAAVIADPDAGSQWLHTRL